MMRVEDSVKLAIPFVFGITLSVIYLQYVSIHCEVLTGIILLSICYLLVRLCRIEMSPNIAIQISALLFLTGCYCTFCHNFHSGYSIGGVSVINSIALEFGEKVKATIEGLSWQDDQNMALCKALITADKASLTKDTLEIFRKSGASHILALSGMHLGFLYLILSKLLSFSGNSPVSKRLRSIFIILCSGFFTLMTGAAPSLVRAFIFITINEISKITCRHSSSLHSLCIAMLIQLAVNPQNIRNIGFQLSYLAMTGVIIVFPVIARWLSDCKDILVRKIWEISSLSISCQIFTAPAVWYHFKSFPSYFLITNLIAVPLSGLSMFVCIVVIFTKSIGIEWSFLLNACEFIMGIFRKSLYIISQLS